MPENQLRQELEKLRSEVANTGNDPESKQRLETLITEIEKKLAHPDDTDQHNTLVNEIRESINHFEAEHPRATGILNDIMVALISLTRVLC
jgi:CII-binding regulator of phage lambda lysogenization HflD